MRISDWSSDVCSSDLTLARPSYAGAFRNLTRLPLAWLPCGSWKPGFPRSHHGEDQAHQVRSRSEEHTSELQSLMRISYAVFCLKKKNNKSHKKQTKCKSHTSNTLHIL